MSYLQMAQRYCIPIKILLTKSWWLIMNCKKLRIGSKPTNFQLMSIRPILWLWVHQKKTFKFKNDISVLLDGRCLSRVNKTKFLGVIIDENLSFKYHVEAISNTMSRNIGILNKLKHFVPKRILHCIYCSIILPFLSYGILVWGNTHTIYLERLHKLQKGLYEILHFPISEIILAHYSKI